MSWQSQPRQGLDNKDILQLIQHDESKNNIHLFLRQDKRSDYMYYGRLGYLEHDSTREKPVYFQWQLLDWDEIDSGVSVMVDAQVPIKQKLRASGLLKSQDTPNKKALRSGVDKESFRARKVADFAERDAKNREIGLKGELLVLNYEIERLKVAGLGNLAEKVRHVSVVEGDGAGYDILSYDEMGRKKYIEVKTTRGGLNTDFFISPNEINFADIVGAQYSIYRVYDFDPSAKSGLFYEVVGSPLAMFEAIPTGFRLIPKIITYVSSIRARHLWDNHYHIDYPLFP